VDNIVSIGLSRQMVLQRQLDVVANNLANVNTNGYKAEGVMFQQFLAHGANGQDGAGRPLSMVNDTRDFLDFSAGSIVATKNPLDLAIDGKGFLVVQTAAGPRYTRNGALTLDPKGRLVTGEGDPVLGTGGPITFSPQETDISIAPDGTVSSSQGDKGRLRLVKFADLTSLKRQGFSLYASDAQPEEVAPGAMRLVSRALEKSNVEPITQTARLIEISRAYQAVTNAMQSTGNLQESAIQKLADVAA
jgi:flagellar basal-body rod protein FlgF